MDGWPARSGPRPSATGAPKTRHLDRWAVWLLFLWLLFQRASRVWHPTFRRIFLQQDRSIRKLAVLLHPRLVDGFISRPEHRVANYLPNCLATGLETWDACGLAHPQSPFSLATGGLFLVFKSSASSVRISRLTDCRMMIALNCRDDKIHQFARSPAPYRYRSRAESSPSAAKPIPGAMARATLASVTRTVA